MALSLEEILEKVRQHPKLVLVEDFELAVQRLKNRTVRFCNGAESSRKANEKMWVSLRIIHRRQPGRAVLSFRPTDSITTLVESAFESSRRSSPDPWFRFPIWKAPARKNEGELGELALADSFYGNLPPSLLPDSFDENHETWEFETLLCRKTEKIQLKDRRRLANAQFTVMNKGTDERFFRVREAQTTGSSFSLEWLRSLLEQGSALKRAVPYQFRAGDCFLVTPAVGASLLEHIATWFFADWVQAGRSPLAFFVQKGHGYAPEPSPLEGLSLFSPAVTLIDDGTAPGSPFSCPFDMEGALTQKTTIVEKGQLKDLLYDTYFATRENRLSTGNFHRSPHAASPRIEASSFYLKPGSKGLGDLLNEVSRGVLVSSLESLEPVPFQEGRFELRGRGWRVAQGRCVEPLSDISLTFGMMDFFRKVTAVGSDLSFFRGFGSPSIFFDEMPIQG